jgi:hypothetical protein
MTSPTPQSDADKARELLDTAMQVHPVPPEQAIADDKARALTVAVPRTVAAPAQVQMLSETLSALHHWADAGRRAQQVLDGLGDTGTVAPRG